MSAFVFEGKIKMKFKRISVILAALCIALSASACNGSGSGTSSEKSSAENSTVVLSEVSSETGAESGKEASGDVSGEVSEAGTSKEETPEDTAAQRIRCLDQKHKYTYDLQAFKDETVKELERRLTSSYVLLYDAAEDKVLFSSNGEMNCYPASTTKLLTAITMCKLVPDPQTVITVGNEVYMIDSESSRAGLEPGMKLTMEMLMDALLIPSGNDAAYVMAVQGGRLYKNDETLSAQMAIEAFMELANKIAANIGTTRTHFVTPDGIHSQEHFTNARDLAVIADYAETIPVIKNSVKKPVADWTLVSGENAYWKNTNYILDKESLRYSEYCTGIKTGFTDEAGNSLIASAEIDGHVLIAVAMNAGSSVSRFDDCNILFEKGFELYGLKYTYKNQKTD